MNTKTEQQVSMSQTSRSRIIHYAVLGALVAAGIVYWAIRPDTLNPMADPQAAKAMALVQTHPAHQAATIRQAISERVRLLKEDGRGVYLGQWNVERIGEKGYLVSILMREEGSRGWIERQYTWRVDVHNKAVQAIGMPAMDVMRLEDLPPSPFAGSP